jgi:hypothetical protein
MFVASFVIQYFIMSFIMTNSIKNIKNSTGKIYISLIMALLMSLVEVGMHDVFNFMISTKYYGLLVSLLIIFTVLYKKQIFINDKSYLEEMIEHHSMALLTSNAIINKTKNTNIKQLAENIVKTQNKEIEAMNAIIKEITPVKKEIEVKNDLSVNEVKNDGVFSKIQTPENSAPLLSGNPLQGSAEVKKDAVTEEIKNENSEKLKKIIN